MPNATVRVRPTAYGELATTDATPAQELARSLPLLPGTSMLVDVVVLGHGYAPGKAIPGVVDAAGVNVLSGTLTKFVTEADENLRLYEDDEIIIGGSHYKVVFVAGDTTATVDRVLTATTATVYKVLHTSYSARLFLQSYATDPPTTTPVIRYFNGGYTIASGGQTLDEAGTITCSVESDGCLVIKVSPAYATNIMWSAYLTAYPVAPAP